MKKAPGDHHGPDRKARGIRNPLGIHSNMPTCFNPIVTKCPFSAPAPSDFSADEKVAYERSASV